MSNTDSKHTITSAETDLTSLLPGVDALGHGYDLRTQLGAEVVRRTAS